jgi:hypothetical protein
MGVIGFGTESRAKEAPDRGGTVVRSGNIF